jgi:hypothetical protein
MGAEVLTTLSIDIESLGVVSIALASFIPPNSYCSFKLVLESLFLIGSCYFFSRYFSIIKLAIGPAMVAPKPFSTKMAMAILDYP